MYTAVNIDMQKIAQEELAKGLRELDKRQGYRGPLQRLTPEAIEPFMQELQKEWAEKVPENGEVVKGVVIRVNDDEGAVMVRFSEGQGIIGIADMDWARKPDPEVPYHEKMIKRPSDALRSGDVILVRLKSNNAETGQWELALEQEPKAQGALLSIEAQTGYVKTMVGGLDFTKNQFNRAVQSRRPPGSAFKTGVYAAA